MKRTYLLLTDDDMNCKIAEGIKGKEIELMHYDFEASAHQSTIDELGDIEWDDKTIEYRELGRDALAARAVKNNLTPDQIAHIADLVSLDDAKIRLNIVNIELAKVTRHYNNFCNNLPAGPTRDAVFSTLATKATTQS